MTVGIVLLAHGHLRRAMQVAVHLDRQNVPVAFHIDAGTDVPDAVTRRLARLRHLRMVPRRRTPWGSWGLVEASLAGAAELLARRPEIGHVCLISGGCLPIRPMTALRQFLADHSGEDFIESVVTGSADWVMDGLGPERFTMHFPVCYRGRPRLHRILTGLQRRLPQMFRRRPPEGVTLCLGSQWWCLSRQTLEAILADPQRPALELYFRGVWLPDEGFFQTMARRHSRRLHGHSLTWAPFDATGRPVTFYDDHLMALRSVPVDRFFVRKIWPGARVLYRTFLSDRSMTLPGDGAPLRRLARVAQNSEPMLTPAIPRKGDAPGQRPYRVLWGADLLFPGLGQHLAETLGGAWLGQLTARGIGWLPRTDGGLSAAPSVLRANPTAYLANLLADAPGEGPPVFSLDIAAPPEAASAISRDRHAHVTAVAGAWTLGLVDDVSGNAQVFAAHRRIEATLLKQLGASDRSCRMDLFSLEEASARPEAVLAACGLDAMAVPMADTVALGRYLQAMRDAGVNPRLRCAAPRAVPARIGLRAL